jgi:cytochrome bd ubiquinol oxidase subunit II
LVIKKEEMKMFENLSLLALQHYWWIIISLLGGILVFLMFVQGGQTLIGTLAKSDDEKSVIINATGRKWEFTFTTLVTFGGAFFASFPLFYSTSFGGAYWVWITILFAFIIQAVSYEFRSKPSNFLGKKNYEWFLYLNGLISTILIGAAVATFFTGSQFSISELKSSHWEMPSHGLEAVLNVQNVFLGLAVLFLSRVLANLYFMKNIDNDNIISKVKKSIIYNAIPFLVFFLSFVIGLMFSEGFAVNPDTKSVYMEKYKYFHNMLAMPLNTTIFLIGVVLVLAGIIRAVFAFNKAKNDAIWFAGLGTVLTVFSLFILAGFNNTSYYPSSFDLQSSLTIENSSSSHYTLTAMSYVSLLVPFVLAYIFYAWRALNKKKITIAEISGDAHSY